MGGVGYRGGGAASTGGYPALAFSSFGILLCMIDTRAS